MHNHFFTDGEREVYLAHYMTEQGEPTIQPSIFYVYYTLLPQRQKCFQARIFHKLDSLWGKITGCTYALGKCK